MLSKLIIVNTKTLDALEKFRLSKKNQVQGKGRKGTDEVTGMSGPVFDFKTVTLSKERDMEGELTLHIEITFPETVPVKVKNQFNADGGVVTVRTPRRIVDSVFNIIGDFPPEDQFPFDFEEEETVEDEKTGTE